MSTDSLSQNEIDLLFNAGGDVEAISAGASPHDVQIYDFKRPARISSDRKRSLEAIYGLLCKSLEGWLTGRVRDAIEIELQSVEQLTFGEFILALPSPCASYKFDVTNHGGQQGVIDFGQEFAYFLVDRLLGGRGIATIPERPLTPIERMVVRIVAERVAYQLGESWRDYVKMDIELSGFESIPEMLQIASRQDPVLVGHMVVHMANTSSILLLCLPFGVLEKFFTGHSRQRVQRSQGTPEERARERRAIESSVRSASVEISARLPEFRVPVRDLVALKPGSLVNTGLEPRTDLVLKVSGQRRFSATAGRAGNRLAVKVLDAVEPDPGEEKVLQPRVEP